jgi:hypothetical protein
MWLMVGHGPKLPTNFDHRKKKSYLILESPRHNGYCFFLKVGCRGLNILKIMLEYFCSCTTNLSNKVTNLGARFFFGTKFHKLRKKKFREKT